MLTGRYVSTLRISPCRRCGGAHQAASGPAASPSYDGARLAVGYDDSTRVDVLDGNNLAPLHPVVTRGHMVAWAPDGTLTAGGHYDDSTGDNPVFAWAAGGRGPCRKLPAGRKTVSGVVPLPGGDLLVATQDPLLARFASYGRAVWALPSPLADFRPQHTSLRVSDDGGLVEFGYAHGGDLPGRFDLARLVLDVGPMPDPRAASPRQ